MPARRPPWWTPRTRQACGSWTRRRCTGSPSSRSRPLSPIGVRTGSSRRRSGPGLRSRRDGGWRNSSSAGSFDVEQVHNLVAWRDHLPWLEAERDAGRIGKLGVTHYTPAAFDELARRCERSLRRGAAAAQPARPGQRAGAAAARSRARPGRDRRSSAGEGGLLHWTPPRAQLEPLAEFGIETWPQALLKWVLSDERVDVAIPATRNPERTCRRTRGRRAAGSAARSATTSRASQGRVRAP